jgi:hypothetical protein
MRASCALRDFLYRNEIPFEWVEVTDDTPGAPACVFADGTRIERPTIQQITPIPSPPLCDAVGNRCSMLHRNVSARISAFDA